MRRPRWPEWRDWELELSPHLFKRMADRRSSEPDLRAMLDHPRGYRPDIIEGRWVVVVVYRKRTWEVVAEPDPESRHLVVVAAYPYEGV